MSSDDMKTTLSALLSITPLESFLDTILKTAASSTSSSSTTLSGAMLVSRGFSMKGQSNSSDIEAIAKAVYSLYHDSLSKSVNEIALRGRLTKLGLSSQIADAIAGGYSRGRNSALSLARTSIVSNLSTSTLDDFDWQVSHVVSSARLKSVEEQSITLSLTLNQAIGQSSGQDGGKEVVKVELSPVELDALIGELESAAVRSSAIMR
jgi:hypothetical protein